MNSSSGTLRSRSITPSSPLTDKKIDAYKLQGVYGIFAKQQMEKLLKAKKKPTSKPKPVRLHKNSLAIRTLDFLL